MSFESILSMTLRAARFALPASLVYALIRLAYLRARKRAWTFKAELRAFALAFYLFALFEITVLRGGVDWEKARAGGRKLYLTPFGNLKGLRGWPLWYNVGGNLAWFLPLGLLGKFGSGIKGLARCALTGAVISLSIEFSQYALMTGYPELDDVLFNTLGAVLGYAIARAMRRLSAAPAHPHKPA